MIYDCLNSIIIISILILKIISGISVYRFIKQISLDLECIPLLLKVFTVRFMY